MSRRASIVSDVVVWFEAAEDVTDVRSVVVIEAAGKLGCGKPGPGRRLIQGFTWERPCKAGEIVRVGISRNGSRKWITTAFALP